MVGDAQLSACGHDFIDFIRGRSNLRGHLLGRRSQRIKLGFRGIDGLANAGEGAFKVDTGLDRCCAQGRKRRADCGGHRPANGRGRFAGGVQPFPGVLTGFAQGSPGGGRGAQVFVGVIDLGPGLCHFQPCPRQGDFGILHRGSGLLDFVRIVDSLCSLKLLPGRSQRSFVLLNGAALEGELAFQHR